MHTTEVKPPRAAEAVPVAMVSLAGAGNFAIQDQQVRHGVEAIGGVHHPAAGDEQ
jgi:hypothetical protein